MVRDSRREKRIAAMMIPVGFYIESWLRVSATLACGILAERRSLCGCPDFQIE